MSRRATGEQWLALGVIVLGLIMAWQITDIPADAGYARIGPRFFPTLVVTGLVMCGGALLLRATRRPARLAEPAEEGAEPQPDADWRMFAMVSGALIAHMALIGLIGFTLAGTLLCFGICRALETKKPWRDAVLSFLLTWGLFQLFVLLGLNLPSLITGVL
ncbi:tripartite tricarboxylate transporter TctB family protein [Neisseriaceae bacterium JH1-16]|nr:tripartite tricarboxylate transporter TctB family protein [Neisseriaceae bacterium JH1-16]